ncbi:MAG: RICIN domain-containing protein [Gloeomargarita sp. SKYG98]|nr:RICIN domain-containing protein [Gloeomargarita sp. SKYG98]
MKFLRFTLKKFAVNLLMAGASAAVLLTTTTQNALALNGIFCIRPATGSKYLDSRGGDISTPGNPIFLWNYWSGGNQHFRIQEVAPGSEVHSISLAASGAFIQADPRDPGAVVLSREERHRWVIRQSAPGLYTISRQVSGAESSPNIQLFTPIHLVTDVDNQHLDGGRVYLTSTGHFLPVPTPGIPSPRSSDRYVTNWVIEPVPGLRVIPHTRWLSALQRLFDRTQVRLNTFTPRRNEFGRWDEDAFYRPNDSYLRMEIEGRTLTVPLNIPLIRRDPSSIYVVDVNSRSVRADFRGASSASDGGRLGIVIEFESDGHEFWTNCVNNVGCFAIGDRRIDMDNAQLRIELETTPNPGGGITYREPRVNLTANIRVSGCHDDLFAFLCDWFAPGRDNQIRQTVEQTVANFLRQEGTRTLVSAAMTRALGIDASRPVQSVGIYANGDLEVVQR